MTKPLILLGAGGHAKTLADILLDDEADLLGLIAPTETTLLGERIPWLGTDDELARQAPDDFLLVNGLGSIASVKARRVLYARFEKLGFSFANLCHSSAISAKLNVEMGPGVQQLAASIIGPNCQIEHNVLLNTRSVIEHDCIIGAHSHIASGAVVCGGCHIESSVHIGAGATLIQGLSIGAGAVIAAGAVVTQNVEPLTLMAGVPAKPVRKFDEQELA